MRRKQSSAILERALMAARIAAFLAAMVSLAPVFAQEQRGHAHHAMAAQQPAKLEVAEDAAGHLLVLRIGPLKLPANIGHTAMPQAPDLFWMVPLDGWLVSYAPQLVDDKGQALPNHLLHHVGFWNAGRSDFLCPNKEEHIFGAGGEMNQWPALPGYGYQVKRGDRIRIGTMFHNPTATAYPKAYLEIKIGYQSDSADVSRKSAPGATTLHSVFPVWLDVQRCGESGYDLNVGPNVRSAEFVFQQNGTLLGLGGHLHDYGRMVEVINERRNQTVARLEAQLDPAGHILGMPMVIFLAQGGYKIASGERFRVTAMYQNTSGHALPDGAMGIAVGYFLPDDGGAMAAFVRKK